MATSRTAKSARAWAASMSHLGERHLLVGLVDEIQGAAAARVVAHHAVEDNQRSVFGPLQAGDRRVRVDALVDERDMRRVVQRATAHWRKQRHFVAVFQKMRDSYIFAIDSDRDGSPEGIARPRSAAGSGRAIARDGRAAGKVEFTGLCGNHVFKDAEEEDTYTHAV